MSNKLIEKINTLRREKNAVILAHNYQVPEVQDIADFVGDSFQLSRQAAETEAAVIVFCGVLFMAETAAILSPKKTVLIPDKDAGCPMADMITAQQLNALKTKHPGAKVVCYVNSDAEVKAASDVCCTSSNALRIVQSMPDEIIIFVPDKYLGSYVAQKTGRSFILWNGYCPTHVRLQPEMIRGQKEKHPKAKVLVHPECIPTVWREADEVLSTGGMLQYVQECDVQEYIIGTESGILHTLRKQNPEKRFYSASEDMLCPNMKRINLEKILWSLEDMAHKVVIAPEVQVKAKKALDLMLDSTKNM